MLSQNQIDIIIKTMKPFNPTKIGIFGSVARSEENENSDIDILYQLKNTIGLFNLSQMKEELEDNLKRKVDLVELTAIHPLLKDKILNDVKFFYEE